MEWSMATLSPEEKYHLLSDAVVPRPIAWISTINHDGLVNVAPFSWFNLVTNEPPLVAVSVNRSGKTGAPKDTARNLLETRECVIHLPSRDHAPQVAASGASFAPHESEAEALGLALSPSRCVRPPRLTHCALALEGRLYTHLEIGDPVVADHLLIEIVQLYAADDVWQDGRIHPAAFDPLMRLGGMDYASIGERFNPPPSDRR